MPENFNYIEFTAAIFGLICVVLTAKENIWCWPTGIISVLLSAIFYYQQTLYASMYLQFVFLLLCIQGWYDWLFGGHNKTELKISLTPKKYTWPLIIITLMMFITMGFIFDKESNDELPYIDSFLTACSLTAQWMMNKKLVESWWLWIPVDLIYTVLHLYKHNYWFFIMYFSFVVFAGIGYRLWVQSLKKSQTRL